MYKEWDIEKTYSFRNKVYFEGVIYTSDSNFNRGNIPKLTGFWYADPADNETEEE